ncbi:UDP-glucose dehydrogenase family protein [Legionella adelaidensis]|nr:UDP-glucose/GDP-mannose dehydrogenase family protein [Legionella adelaidensis]
MDISIYGAGYVGLVSAACFAKLGHQVVCADINQERIHALQLGGCPIYEEGLPELIKEQVENKRLLFTSDIPFAINAANIHFIATGTPSQEDGSADLTQVFAVAKQIALHTTENCIIVTKSTVPVGTGDLLQQEIAVHNKQVKIDLLSNPEFLREGCAVQDFLKADRIVLGGEDAAALERLKDLYQPLIAQGIPLLCMSRVSAELTKYTANAFLACKISFMNQISRLAEKVGANIDEIREGISLDHRIGPHFLQAGIGYGGSCFPKDNRALVNTAKNLNIKTPLLTAIDEINLWQKEWVVEQLLRYFDNNLKNKTIAIWGLSFKPGTDDLREASSIVIIKALLALGVHLRLYDPVAMLAAKAELGENSSITWSSDASSTIQACDALVIATEWPEFKSFPLNHLKEILGSKPIFDGRNCYPIEEMVKNKISFYASVGRPTISN